MVLKKSNLFDRRDFEIKTNGLVTPGSRRFTNQLHVIAYILLAYGSVNASGCTYDSVTLSELQEPCPDDLSKTCIRVNCPPSEEKAGDDFVCVGIESDMNDMTPDIMDAGNDMNDMTLDMMDAGNDMHDMTPDMMDAGNDMSDMALDMMDAENDMNNMTLDMMDAGNDMNDMTPDMNPCSQAMYDSANQLLGVLNESKQAAPAATRFIGGGYGNYTFTCAGPVPEIFEGTVSNNAGMQVKVLEIKTPECNSYWEFTPGNLGTRSITIGWQSEITASYLEVVKHGSYPNISSIIPNQQAITLTMRYDRNTQEIDGQPLCSDLVSDIENKL